VPLNRQADSTPTGANGQDWLALSQIWLDSTAATGEAQHDVIAHRDGVHVPPDTLDDT